MSQVNFSQQWIIIARETIDPIIRLAVNELHQHLQSITGCTMTVGMNAAEDQPGFILSWEDGAEDGFSWAVVPQDGDEPARIKLHGYSPRGLLYAVYSFLEALGCRWIAPGSGGEYLPRGAVFTLPAENVNETPAFAGRCLVIGHHAFLQDAADWLTWAARNRLNTVFFHVIEGAQAFGAAPSLQYQAQKEILITLARERGMTIEYGGHGMTGLLPRQLFKQISSAFRYANGKRTPDHNFCPSSPEGIAVIRKNAESYFWSHPEVDVFHLWADDIPGGGWCECDQCRGKSPSDQLLLAVNAIAETLELVNPHAQISFLVYHDTEAVPTAVTPRPNVCMLWAPRKRCYAHSLDDAQCHVNVPHYTETFKAQVEFFEKAGAAPARIFEYYLDAILFKSVLPPLPSILQRDLLFYHDAGAHTIQALLTGDAPLVNPQLNPWLFARLAWDARQDVDGLMADFSRTLFKTDLTPYYRALESAYALALDLHPEQIKLLPVDDLLAFISEAPSDMADPVYAPPEVLREKAQRNKVILDYISRAKDNLDAARSSAEKDAWQFESYGFELHNAWLRFDLYRVCLYDAVASNKLEEARRFLTEAQKALDEVLAWGETHITDKRHRLNFRLIHLSFWQLRLNKIKAEYLERGLKGLWIRLWGLLQVGLLLFKMRNIYSQAIPE